MPAVRPAESVRCGFMPPDKGKVFSPLPTVMLDTVTRTGLSTELSARVEALYNLMDLDGNKRLTKEEAKKFFKKFPEISANAMFNEVDEDRDGLITLEEFMRFWEQVLCNGYDEQELMSELDDLLEGNTWVNYADDRDVGFGHRSATLIRRNR